MNFLRLLTVGQSLKRTQSCNSPYKLCPDNYLPKFGSPARPSPGQPPAKAAPSAADLKFAESLFACSPAMTAATANAAPPPLMELANPATSLPGKAPSIPGRISQSPAAGHPPAAERPGTTRPESVTSPAPAAAAGGASGRWGLKRNPFFSPRSSEVLPRGEQRELSLDMVRVVRNDLSGDDLELVCAASRRAQAASQGGEPADDVTGLAQWTRVAARVLNGNNAVTTS